MKVLLARWMECGITDLPPPGSRTEGWSTQVAQLEAEELNLEEPPHPPLSPTTSQSVLCHPSLETAPWAPCRETLSSSLPVGMFRSDLNPVALKSSQRRICAHHTHLNLHILLQELLNSVEKDLAEVHSPQPQLAPLQDQLSQKPRPDTSSNRVH